MSDLDVYSKEMSQHQLNLIERALCILARCDDCGWLEMPMDLRLSFSKYMAPEVWTHLPDLLTLRHAALLIIRDAIARGGEFGPAADSQVHQVASGAVLVDRLRR